MSHMGESSPGGGRTRYITDTPIRRPAPKVAPRDRKSKHIEAGGVRVCVRGRVVARVVGGPVGHRAARVVVEARTQGFLALALKDTMCFGLKQQVRRGRLVLSS